MKNDESAKPSNHGLKKLAIALIFVLLLFAVLYALHLGDPVTIDAKYVKVDIGASIQNTDKAKQQKTADPDDAASKVPDDNKTKWLAANGLTVEEVQQLLVGTATSLPKAKILWVDDHPSNNFYQRLALASLGIFCDAYTNNYDGRVAARMTHYDIVISDLRRDNEKEDGLDLLAHIREEPGYKETPFFIYTTVDQTAVAAEADKRHISMATAVATNDPAYLLKDILRDIPREKAEQEGRIRRFINWLTGKK